MHIYHIEPRLRAANATNKCMMVCYKKHVGYNLHPTVMEHFADQLRDYKQGKGSVQFPVDSPLPITLIFKMVKYRMKLLGER
jgi:uncharacterized protein YdhG (YjbR/CyaY superfamily)